MPEKTGAGGKPQDYSENNGRYGNGVKSFSETRDDYEKASNGTDFQRTKKEYEEAKEKPKRLDIPDAYKFNRRDTKHHIDHAKEMGYKNMRDYETAAVEFFNSDRGKLYYSEARDRYYRYNEKTREFVSVSGDVVHTFKYVTKKEFNRKIRQDKLYEQ